jgi:2-C-methyl-D-erythritol 4-phosphate cytidylyltransferase/2-C-methyl-D-erythritol 2,4-cyclodiphosphate synthase
MRVAVAILAGGSSTRLGLDKTLEDLGGKPVWRWSYDTYRCHPEVSHVFVVVSVGNAKQIEDFRAQVVPGGNTREQSARNALAAIEGFDALLFHDAARPFVDHATISRTLAGIREKGASAACVPVKDTIRKIGGCALDRSRLIAMQTPQGALCPLLRQAFENSDGTATDDIALLERIGIECQFVAGSEANFKITTMEDLQAARARLPQKHPRVGSGYDVHAFSEDPTRTLMLGGVAFEGTRALDGHSDADVLLHAITDALLGAAALGDIGQHFPNADAQWKGAASLHFLEAARDMLSSLGWTIVNIDATIIAEEPKIMKRASEIRASIAGGAGIEVDQVSIKATTNEKLGFIGRSEGIAAIATAMIAPARGDN